MLEPIFYDIVEMTISAAIVIAAVIWLFPKIDKRYSINWRKIFWAVLGIRLLIPYNVSFSNTPLRFFAIQGNITQQNGTITPVSFLIAVIWCIGVICYSRIQYLHFKKFKIEVLDTAEIILDKAMISALEKAKEELLLHKKILFLHSRHITTPMVTGIFKPVLLLPKRVYEVEELHLILIHECMHIDNYDILYKMLMTAVASVHWFNPFVHKMVLLSYRDLELVCDACVAEDMKGMQRVFYAKTILDSIRTEKYKDISYSTCFYGNETIMKQRIDTIFDEEPKKKGLLLLFAILGIYLVISLSISCGYKSLEQNNTKVILEYNG